jgi:hypothetical protein
MNFNPITNRWAALGLVAAVMLVAAVLADSDGVLSRAANFEGDGAAVPEGVVQVVAPVAEATPVVVVGEEEPEEPLGLEEDGATVDDEGIDQVIDEPSNDEGGGVVVVTEEQTEEQEE